jgi:N-acetylneuraminic acid mutarotase
MKRQVFPLLMVILFFFSVRYDYSQGKVWQTIPNMHVPRNLLSLSQVDGVLYAIGGARNPETSISFVESYDTYDATAAIWTLRTDLPEPLCGSVACTLMGKIFVIGGNDGGLYGTAVPSVYMYDPALDNWTQKNDFPMLIQLASACVVNNETIYIIGGASTGFSPVYKAVYKYDQSSDEWTPRADMHIARFGHSATVVDGKIYIFGGTKNTSFIAIDTGEVYDPAIDTWNIITPVQVGRSLHTASAVNGKIYILGGGPDSQEIYKNVDEYDPILNIWTTKSTMPTPRWGLKSCTIGEKIYTVGGADSLNRPLPIVEVYNPLRDLTDVEESGNSKSLPNEYNLYQNYPNPFNPSTKIRYSVPQSSNVVIKVFDILGKEIETLVNVVKPAGSYELNWNSENLPSGVYFYQLQAGDFVETKKMILIK